MENADGSVTDAGPTADDAAGEGAPAGEVARRQTALSLFRTAFFDMAAPLGVYFGCTAAGTSSVTALVASGAPPAVGIVLGLARRRRLDGLGVVVLLAIGVGTAFGVFTRNARLVLIDGTVPGLLLGVACLGSLWTRRPVMFRLVLAGLGGQRSGRGQEFDSLWQYPLFRHIFRVITIVWGVTFLAEAAVQLIVIEVASAGTAKTSATLLPLVFVGVVAVWNIQYGKHMRRRGELAKRRAAGVPS